MDSSTTHRATPLCLDLTFPSGATQEEEEEEKTENRKLKGFWEFILSCLPPDSVFACTHQTLGETDRQKHTAQMYRHTETEEMLPGSLGLSRRLILLHRPNWNTGILTQRLRPRLQLIMKQLKHPGWRLASGARSFPV